MVLLNVERLGGFAGFGSPGSHLRSQGVVETVDLTPADQHALEVLFDNPPGGDNPPDAFKYRMTRQTAQGLQTIEVPEQHVPTAVRAVVKDELI
jgi:Emfourin